jgi:Tfp pilus assembly protein PilO
MLSVAIFFVYVNRTWNGSIAEHKAAIAVDEEALKAAEKFMDQQSQLEAERNAIDSADLARLSTFLPGSVDNVHLILDLNALAARSGLSLSNVGVTTNASAAGATGASSLAGTSAVGSVDLALSAVGTYSALQTFLSGVERSARLLDVQDISATGSDTGVYTYQMKMRIYWLH